MISNLSLIFFIFSVTKFLSLQGDKRILPQSFRIPRSVHRLANDVVNRIKNRYVKPWQPRLDKGTVNYVSDVENVDFSIEGTWLCMARSKYLLNRVKDVVKDYDRDFDDAMEKTEIEEMLNMKRGDPYAEGTD